MGKPFRQKNKEGKPSAAESNPKQRKHRDNAKHEFTAKKNLSVSMVTAAVTGLTTAALNKHVEDAVDEEMDAIANNDDGNSNGSDDDIAGDLIAVSMERYRNSNLQSHKEIFAVLAVVKEVVATQQFDDGASDSGVISPTAYFAALMTVLDQYRSGESAEDMAALTAILHLLTVVLPHVPSAVLQGKFFDAVSVFMPLLGAAQQNLEMHSSMDTSTTALQKSVVECLGVLLGATNTWSQSSTQHVYQTLLAVTLHAVPKVRKKAHDVAIGILKATSASSTECRIGATVTAANFFGEALKRGDTTEVLHTMNFLRHVFALLPSKNDILESLLVLMRRGEQQITIAVLHIFGVAFSSISATVAAQLVTALYELEPNVRDETLIKAWLSALAAGVVSLAALDIGACMSELPRFVRTAMDFFTSDETSLSVPTATNALKRVISECLSVEASISYVLSATREKRRKGCGAVAPIAQVVDIVMSGLGYQSQPCWGQIMQILGEFFVALKAHSLPLLGPTLSLAADLYSVRVNDHDLVPFRNELKELVGTAIVNIGPRAVLSVLPLGLDSDKPLSEFPRGWLLPLLTEHVQRTELGYFISDLLPLADKLGDMAGALEKAHRNLEAKTYATLRLQIWASFPGFCIEPTDLQKSFGAIARRVGQALESDAELRPIVCSGLQTLCKEKSNACVLAGFSKNFLPLCFNTYVAATSKAGPDVSVVSTTDPRAIILATTAAYASITDSALLNTFFRNVVKKLLEATSSNSLIERHALMDLSMALIGNLSAESLPLYYRVLRPQLQDADATLQKKSYKALAVICEESVERPEYNAFIREHSEELGAFLAESLVASTASAKRNRLRCLAYVIAATERSDNLDFIPPIVAEVIMCTKEVNERARSMAFKCLVEMAALMKRCEGSGATVAGRPVSLREFFSIVLAGLAGATPHMMSAAILALSRLIFDFRFDFTDDTLFGELLETVVMLLQSRTREVVKSSLGFVKVCLVAMPISELRDHVQSIVTGILVWSKDSRNRFHMKVRVILERLVRKFGYDYIHDVMPEEHRKLLINIRKVNARAKRDKIKRREEHRANVKTEVSSGGKGLTYEQALYGSEDEDDEADSAADKGVSRQPKSKTWLRDDGDDDDDVGMDFLDSRAANRVTTTDPTRSQGHQRKRDNDFTLDKDTGRMIIDDDAEEEQHRAEEEAKLLRRRRYNNGVDMREDDEDDDEQNQRKRKRVPPTAGASFRAKKAQGDIRKKGSHDPYAYVALNPAHLNRRNKHKAKNSFVGMSRSGVVKVNRAGKSSSARKK